MPYKDPEKAKANREKHKEATKERKRLAYLKNKDDHNAKTKLHYENNKEMYAENSKKWRDRHPDYDRIKSKQWYETNKDKMIQWRSDNKDVVRKRFKEWSLKSKDYLRAKYSTKRAVLNQAKIKWADQEKIREIYKEACFLTETTGTQWHVDHVVPLVSKIVCGLHCEANLRVITATENIKKGNRIWPDMP